MSKPKQRSEGLAFGSRLKVEHAGVSPTDYNKRNYVDNSSLEDGRKKRTREPLPALMPVSRPQRVDSSTNPRKANQEADKALREANKKDIQTRGLKDA